MKFCSIASGSSGNCIFTASEETALLVDAGISGTRIEKGLNEINMTTKDIDGLLITHEHSDHIKGLGVLARRYGIPIYATGGTFAGIDKCTSVGKVPNELRHVIKADVPFSVGDVFISPFAISHDAAEPVGFRVEHEGKKCAVATDMGASEVYKVSRTGKEGVPTYEEAYERHTDAQIIINTTPCGMYPAIDDCPLDLSRFPDLCGVIDAIYNPLRTVLILEAQKRGIPAEGGLYMLVVQAVYAAELFADRKIESEKTDQVFKEILNSKRNIVLSGMSLAGKTTLGTLLAKKLDRVLEDTDQMIIRKEQRPITEIFATDGEKYFRDLETEMARTLAPQTGLVIATGGGAILRQENVDALKKNGCIIFLDRPFNQILPADDRPLANTKEKVAALLEKRYPIYKATADVVIPVRGYPKRVAEEIREDFMA